MAPRKKSEEKAAEKEAKNELRNPLYSSALSENPTDNMAMYRQKKLEEMVALQSANTDKPPLARTLSNIVAPLFLLDSLLVEGNEQELQSKWSVPKYVPEPVESHNPISHSEQEIDRIAEKNDRRDRLYEWPDRIDTSSIIPHGRAYKEQLYSATRMLISQRGIFIGSAGTPPSPALRGQEVESKTTLAFAANTGVIPLKRFSRTRGAISTLSSIVTHERINEFGARQRFSRPGEVERLKKYTRRQAAFKERLTDIVDRRFRVYTALAHPSSPTLVVQK